MKLACHFLHQKRTGRYPTVLCAACAQNVIGEETPTDNRAHTCTQIHCVWLVKGCSDWEWDCTCSLKYYSISQTKDRRWKGGLDFLQSPTHASFSVLLEYWRFKKVWYIVDRIDKTTNTAGNVAEFPQLAFLFFFLMDQMGWLKDNWMDYSMMKHLWSLYQAEFNAKHPGHNVTLATVNLTSLPINPPLGIHRPPTRWPTSTITLLKKAACVFHKRTTKKRETHPRSSWGLKSTREG